MIAEFFSTVVIFVLTAYCPQHHKVKLEENLLANSVGVYEPNKVSSKEASVLQSDRELLKIVKDKKGWVSRKCPKCNLILAFHPIEAYHSSSGWNKTELVWSKKDGCNKTSQWVRCRK